MACYILHWQKVERQEHALPSIRILVADDYQGWRQQARQLLRAQANFQIVAEASDGIEAVQKAEELRPDLILLDIGLPKLNGLEAARRIRKLSPESKIIFLTQETSADVVQEALLLGGLGYVVKAHAGNELIAAVRAAIQGKQFVGSGLSGQMSADAVDEQNPHRLFNDEAAGTRPDEKEIACHHEVQFFSDDTSLLAGFASFIQAGLESGNAVIAVVSKSHQERLIQRLQALDVDVATATREGRYLPLDVDETLSTFMVNDIPDPVRFFKAARQIILAVAKGAKGKPLRVSACGQCAPTLWTQGNPDAAILLERLWDEIVKIYKIDILCGYVLDRFQREQETHIYEKICAQHTAVRFS
jgi:DNA-binding NarL/FixJ family response regulator